MLVAEARWFARRIAEFGDAALFPLLNVGSHTEEFRTREQPWIDRHIFAPPRRRGARVVHTDIRPNPGVDLVGDLTDPAFLAEVAGMRFQSVICSNLLEHVPNPGEIARACVAAVAPGGYVLASGPHTFPYHPDPIDTMFRPGVEEFAALFAGAELVRGEVLACGNLTTYLLAKAAADPASLAKNLFRRRKQVVAQTADGLSARQWAPWLVRPFKQTCLVLRKPAG